MLSINVAVKSNMAAFVKCPQFILAPQGYYAGLLLVVLCKVMLNYVLVLFDIICVRWVPVGTAGLRRSDFSTVGIRKMSHTIGLTSSSWRIEVRWP